MSLLCKAFIVKDVEQEVVARSIIQMEKEFSAEMPHDGPEPAGL